MDTAKIVFESFNRTIQQAQERFIDSHEEAFIKDMIKTSKELDDYVKGQQKKWACIPLEELEGRTPAQFFNDLTTIEAAFEVFSLGAVMCDEDLPDAFVDKLRSMGEDAVKRLLKIMQNKSLLENEMTGYMPVLAMNILVKWKVEETLTPLIDLLMSCNEEEEYFIEKIQDALAEMGNPAVDPILSSILQAKEIGFTEEYLLTALVKVGCSHKTDRILKCLKETFLKMSRKDLGAIYFAQYGDGRAIPFLRGYVEKNKETIDPETFVEINDAVRRLGGSLEN